MIDEKLIDLNHLRVLSEPESDVEEDVDDESYQVNHDDKNDYYTSPSAYDGGTESGSDQEADTLLSPLSCSDDEVDKTVDIGSCDASNEPSVHPTSSTTTNDICIINILYIYAM